MARVREADTDNLPEDAAAVYRRFLAEYGPFQNQARVLARRPPAVRHLLGLLLDLSGEALVSKRHVEIALLVVSKLNECRYCVAHHTPRLIQQGLPPEAASAILESHPPGMEAADLLVRDYAIHVTSKPQMIREEMFDRLRDHFSDDQIVELTLRIALGSLFTRFNDALGIELEDGVMQALVGSGGKSEDLPETEKKARASAATAAGG